MGKREDIVIIYNKKKRSKLSFIFISIIGFIAIFMPFFGSAIRYQASTLFQNIFDMFGSFCKLAGMVMVGYTFLISLLIIKFILNLKYRIVILISNIH